MPGSNGLDVLVEIKKTLPNTSVLMVSGSNDRATIVTAIQLGASGFILKPFNSGIVLDTLDKTTARLKQNLNNSN
jgi:two-component system chemotaxis response regulator CheY